MDLQPGRLYHIYNRGNNQEPIFYTAANYLYFLRKMRAYLLPHMHMMCWCLMPNHFHWLVRIHEEADAAARQKDLRILLSSYTRAIQQQQHRTGSLFQQHTQARELLDEQYARTCFCYIQQNPLRAGLVTQLADWQWSSYLDYAGGRHGNLCHKPTAFQYLDLPTQPEALHALITQTIPSEAKTWMHK